jgi:addiction module RelB/DinJ family antitoxin
MKTAALSVKIDPKVKREAEKIAEQLGLTVSAMVNAHLKEVIRTKSVSYAVAVHEPSPMLKKAIKAGMNEYKEGKTKGPFDNADDFMRALKL